MKHFLGLRATFHGRSVTLLYLFWEPANAASISEYDVHAQELVRFAEGLEDETVRFCSMTYPQLWQAWGNVDEPSLREHVRHLRGRYAVAI